MKKLLCIMLFFFICNILVAQMPLEISGQVKNAKTKKSLEFCSVSVFNIKDSLIASSVTDNNGFFSTSINAGYYHFIFSFIGYKNDTIAVMADKNKFIGLIKLQEDEKYLKEVNIKASSRDNLIDRDVQVVTEKLKENTSNTKEVLDKLNGVDYDRYNNSIKVDNDAKVIILVDGLEKDQEYIKNLSPERLKKIEIIRDPGGRYALEGYSAVINIILKKDYQGTELYFDGQSMTDPDAYNSKYIFIQNNLTSTINYTYNKVNLYAKYGKYYNRFNLESSGKKEYNNGLVIEKIPVINNGELNTKIKQLSNDYTIGADYYINPKHTISFESYMSSQPLKNNTSGEAYNEIYSLNGLNIGNFAIESNNKTKSVSNYNSLFYDGKLNEKNTLNSNFTFSNYNDNYSNIYEIYSIYKRIENGTNKKYNTEFYIENLHTFNEKTSLQVGYGNTWQSLNSNYTADEIASNFEYTDVRHKFYSYYSWQLSKNLTFKFGGAGETSSPVANGLKKSYLIFQPYADIKFKPSKLVDIKAKYRSFSNYPDISQTNPYTYIIDQQSVRTGNPYLSPEVTHKISLQTSLLDGLLTIEPYYHFSYNYIAEIGTLRSDNIFEYTYNNVGKYTNYGSEANITIPFGKSLFLQSGFDLFRSSIAYSGKVNEINNFVMSGQLIYIIEKSGLVSGLNYQKSNQKYITAQGYQKGNNDFWIVFIQQPFLKKKLNLTLIYFTPISWGVDFNQGKYIKTDTYVESNIYDISLLKNIVMLQLNYRFNKGKTVNKTEKNIELKKEKKAKSIL